MRTAALAGPRLTFPSYTAVHLRLTAPGWPRIPFALTPHRSRCPQNRDTGNEKGPNHARCPQKRDTRHVHAGPPPLLGTFWPLFVPGNSSSNPCGSTRPPFCSRNLFFPPSGSVQPRFCSRNHFPARAAAALVGNRPCLPGPGVTGEGDGKMTICQRFRDGKGFDDRFRGLQGVAGGVRATRPGGETKQPENLKDRYYGKNHWN